MKTNINTAKIEIWIVHEKSNKRLQRILAFIGNVHQNGCCCPESPTTWREGINPRFTTVKSLPYAIELCMISYTSYLSLYSISFLTA
ncbi:MAG: hypothetical protein ACOC5F_05520 [Candidatus Aminicenantaceae bacterium]